jgi:hypothetical protein
MKFDSLSEAIKYYTNDSADAMANVSAYGIVASETNLIPTNNITFRKSPTQGLMVYGETIWGYGRITNVSQPGS